ncbi:flavodoxin family protein, partial [Ruminococcaceae bacterium OttesenSCG-928-D13]|nr:flavodoxin family protein [Ruminococcaceae bacterium OttesenSCG-928-D13]
VGGSDWNTRVSAVMRTYLMVPMWKVIDDKLFPWSKMLLLDEEKVAQCRQVGVNIANAARDFESAQYLGDPGVCGHCNSRNFFLHADGVAECEVCGIKGELKLEGDRYIFRFPEEQLEHAHDMVPGKMQHMEDIRVIETEFFDKAAEVQAAKDKYKDFIQPSRP